MDDNEIDEIYEDTDTEYDILDNPQFEMRDNEDITTFMKQYKTMKQTYITSHVLTKYEKTRILSERSQQIDDGSIPYIPNIERFNTSYAIALEEFNTQKIPFIIRRKLPHSSTYEYWKLKDMII